MLSKYQVQQVKKQKIQLFSDFNSNDTIIMQISKVMSVTTVDCICSISLAQCL